MVDLCIAVEPWPYCQVPTALVFDPNVCPLALRVYAALLSYQRNDSDAWVSRETLAVRLGVGIRTLRGKVSALEESGWLIRSPTPDKPSRVMLLRNARSGQVSEGGHEAAAPPGTRLQPKKKPLKKKPKNAQGGILVHYFQTGWKAHRDHGGRMGNKKLAEATWNKLLALGVRPEHLLTRWLEFLSFTDKQFVPKAFLTIRNELDDDSMKAHRIRAGVTSATSGTRRVLQENATARSDDVRQSHRDAKAQWESENPKLAAERRANEAAQAERLTLFARNPPGRLLGHISDSRPVSGLSGGQK